jgi:hypothetical protein
MGRPLSSDWKSATGVHSEVEWYLSRPFPILGRVHVRKVTPSFFNRLSKVDKSSFEIKVE